MLLPMFNVQPARDRSALPISGPMVPGRSTGKQKPNSGCLGAIGFGLLLLVFWSAVVFTFYFFVIFYPLRLVVGFYGWKISPDGARLADWAMLGLPFVGALWFGWQGGLSWLLMGAWMGVGFSFWLQWALQDALLEGNPVTKIPSRSRA